MANRDLEATAGTGTPVPERPQNAYLRLSSSTEQVPPMPLADLPQMESGLRNRNPAGSSPRTVAVDSDAPEVGNLLSGDETHIPESTRFASLVRTGSKGLHALVTTGTWSTQSPDELERSQKPRGHDNLKYDRVDDFDKGYPQLAAFVNSDDTFANFRRFGRLSTRMLLHMQNELNDLEKELDALDKQDGQDAIMQARLRGFEGDDFSGWDDKQQELCLKIQEKYVQYADVLLKDASLRALGKPPPRNHMANFTWMQNTKALNEDKRDFLNHPDDFVSISRHYDRRFEDFIETWLDSKGPNFFIKRYLKNGDKRNKVAGKHVHHYSKNRLALLAIVLQVSVVAVLFLVPVFILFLVPTSRAVMAVTASVFVLAFTVALSFMTGAKVQEVFFGTAAYAAVIIMFLGNINQSGPVKAA